MWEKIIIRFLPKVWEQGFNSIEKMNLVTKALEVCWKNKLLKATWHSFVDSVIGWLRDGISECEGAKHWYSERER